MAKRSKPQNGWKELARQLQIINLRRQKAKAIPDKVLKKLASLGLPKNEWVYAVVLDALIRETA